MIDTKRHAENILSALNLAKAIGENDVVVMKQGLDTMLETAIHNFVTMLPKFVPVQTEELGIVYVKDPKFNQFGGIDTHNTQVLRSAAGYYIGDLIEDTFTLDDGKGTVMKMWMPNSRDSQCYWPTREEAEAALIENKYPVKF